MFGPLVASGCFDDHIFEYIHSLQFDEILHFVKPILNRLNNKSLPFPTDFPHFFFVFSILLQWQELNIFFYFPRNVHPLRHFHGTIFLRVWRTLLDDYCCDSNASKHVPCRLIKLCCKYIRTNGKFYEWRKKMSATHSIIKYISVSVVRPLEM